jgi:hypothetical protein
MRKQNQLWNQVAQHSFVSKWAWIKSYLPSQTSLGYDFAYALTLVSDWLWGWWLLVPKGLCGPKFTPLPNKEHPISAQHKPCNQSGLSFDPSCTSWSNSVLCMTHAFSRSVQFVIAVAAFLYHLNWIRTIYTIICYAHVGPSWPYFGPSRQLKARNVFIWHLVPQMNTLILGPLEVCWA